MIKRLMYALNKAGSGKMKGYVDQLKRLGYVLPHDLIVGLILNGLTKYFSGFVRNYQDDKHGGRHCEEKEAVGFASSLGIFTIELFAFPNKSWVYDTGCGTNICITKQGFREARKLKQGALYLYVGTGVRAQHYRLAQISKKRIEKLQHEGLLKSTDDESFDQCVSCLSGKMTRKSFPHRPERATDLLRIIHTDVCGLLRHVSKQGASYFTTFMDDYSRYGYAYLLKHKHEALVKRDTPEKLQQISVKCIFIGYPKKTIEVSGRAVELEEIQDEDTSPSENTSEIPMEVEGFKPPQKEVISVRRSVWTHRAPERLCLNVEWPDAMNAEMQFMKDNQVWRLVDLPPNCKTIGSR
ncbi:retrotransposon protein, putative, ty1-copia subclass [Tanacetum coccineum]